MSSPTRIENTATNAFSVHGELNFDTVPDLWCQLQLSAAETISINFSGVQRSDSSGIALLVDWLKQAKQCGCRLRFINIPPQMRAIIEVAGLSEVIVGH